MTATTQPLPTILLVEDQESLRLLTRRILERHGFHVVTAVDGRDALRMLEQHIDSINVLLSDVVMPSLNGITLAQEVRERFPAVRIVLMSGYGSESLRAAGAQQWTDAMVSKPFTAEALLAAVRRAA